MSEELGNLYDALISIFVAIMVISIGVIPAIKYIEASKQSIQNLTYDEKSIDVYQYGNFEDGCETREYKYDKNSMLLTLAIQDFRLADSRRDHNGKSVGYIKLVENADSEENCWIDESWPSKQKFILNELSSKLSNGKKYDLIMENGYYTLKEK